MEEEKKEKKEAHEIPKRRVSFFKRRKKAEIRPFVRERKKREYKKLVELIVLTILSLFFIATLLYTIKLVVIPRVSPTKFVIIDPQGAVLPDRNDVISLIQNKGLDIDDIQFATDSALVTFTLHKYTDVYMPTDRDIDEQLRLVEAIDQQLMENGERAISIDLRYNKPIVKY